MDLQLSDRVALVAGSSRGIGLATAQAFLAEGACTVVTGRGAASLDVAREALANKSTEDRLLVHQGDLSDADVIQRLLNSIEARWGRLDCVVANIGTGRGPGGWDLQEADWDRLLQANLVSTYRLAQAVLPAMTRAGRGSLVLIASIAGIETSAAPLPYSAAKAALIAYGKNVARQVGSSNVRVNVVAPGNVLFPGGSWERHLAERRDEVLEQIERDVPLRRFAKPEEIADLIVFLSSDRASFIAGACVVADGGQTRSV